MEPFIGQIIMFGGNFAPRGWAFCDGQLLSIASHSALFSLLGTIYGGDGETTFGLPDLRGRGPVHAGDGPGLPPMPLGEKAGSIQGNVQFTLNANQIPPVPMPCNTGEANAASPSGNVPAFATEDVQAYHSVANSVMGTTSGAPQAVSLPTLADRDPYQAINFIIALVGTFPSRN